MDLMYFFNIIKRAKTYKGNVIILDGILVNCYDANDDNDESGHHHIIQPKINDSFYNNRIIFNPSEVYVIMNNFFNKCDEIRKINKLKNKDKNIYSVCHNKEDRFILRMVCEIPAINYSDEQDIEFDYYNENTVEICRLMDIINFRVNTLPDNIKYATKEIDTNIFEDFNTIPRIQYIPIDLDGVKVQVPLIKSFLFGLRKFDKMTLEIVNTISKDLYLYTIHIENNNIVERHISYINNFK